MNVLKLISTVTLTVMSMSLGAMVNRTNFELINSFPKIPVYFKINDEQAWQVLKQNRYQAQVPTGGHLNLTLSASPDGSRPTHFTFSPRLPDAVVGQPTDLMTCYIEVKVNFPSKEVVIVPQNSAPNSRNTKSGLPLAHNITYRNICLFKNLAIDQVATRAHATTPAQTPAANIPATNGTQTPAITTQTTTANTPPAPTPVITTPATPAITPATPAAITTPATTTVTTPPVTTPTITAQTTASTATETTPAAITPATNGTQATTSTTPSTPAANTPATNGTEIIASTAPVTTPAANTHPVNPVLAQLEITPAQAEPITQFFDILNQLLAQVETTRNFDALRKLNRSLIVANLELFKECVRSIRSNRATEGAIEQEEDRLINTVWARVEQQVAGPVANAIVRIQAAQQPDRQQFLQGITHLETLLATWEQTLTQEHDANQAWGTFSPPVKLYTLQFIQFYFAMQDTIVRLRQLN